MKIVDLEYADTKYALEKDLSYEIAKFKYHQKYLLLCIGNEVVSLKIDDVTDTAFYLKIDEEVYVKHDIASKILKELKKEITE